MNCSNFRIYAFSWTSFAPSSSHRLFRDSILVLNAWRIHWGKRTTSCLITAISFFHHREWEDYLTTIYWLLDWFDWQPSFLPWLRPKVTLKWWHPLLTLSIYSPITSAWNFLSESSFKESWRGHFLGFVCVGWMSVLRLWSVSWIGAE